MKKVFSNPMSQDEFNMEMLEAVGLTDDGEELVVKVKWVGLDEEETTWELVSTIYADAPKYLVAQLRTLGLAKKSAITSRKVWLGRLTFKWALGGEAECCLIG